MNTERVPWVSAEGKAITIDRFVAKPIGQADIQTNVKPVDAAERALRRIPPLSDGMTAMTLRSEGIASSRIEGLALGTRRILEARFQEDAVNDPDARRVLANVDLMQAIMSFDEDLSPEVILSWHAELMGDDAAAMPGQFRTVQNWIGGEALTPRNASFVPPGSEDVSMLISDLCVFANRTGINAVVQAALVHAQFETIHPFVDGNGRLGRALIYWVLSRRGVVARTAPAISPIVVRRVEEYIAGLTAYRSDDISTWVAFFSETLIEASAYTERLSVALAELADEWQQRASRLRSDSVVHRIVEDLVAAPIMDRQSVSQVYGVSTVTATTALTALVELGVLDERPLRKAKRGRPGRVYQASALFDVLDAHPADVGRRS